VPVESQGGVADSLAFGAAVLQQKKNMVWFPEGQRSMSGELLPFRPGLGILLEQFQTPVVPVHIDGTYRAMPPGQTFPRMKPITVRFGRPQNPAQLDKEGEGDQPYERIMQALHQHVAKLSRP
jgi:long-chain acyl-CoA synthetase